MEIVRYAAFLKLGQKQTRFRGMWTVCYWSENTQPPFDKLVIDGISMTGKPFPKSRKPCIKLHADDVGHFVIARAKLNLGIEI
jgi:hypothetical protein